MAISKELLLSLLSMDAYNRGYDAGIRNLSDVPNMLVGDVKVLKTINELPEPFKTDAKDAGFYTIAYEVTDGAAIEGFDTGDVIISYRGTDDMGSELLLTDLVDIITYGDYSNPQFALASHFYEQVRASTDGAHDVVLTGHSLGGALAGFATNKACFAMPF